MLIKQAYQLDFQNTKTSIWKKTAQFQESLTYLCIFCSPPYICRSPTTKYESLTKALCQWIQNKSGVRKKEMRALIIGHYK